jgi:hypothetical protein
VMHINGLYQNRSDVLKLISPLSVFPIITQIIASLVSRVLEWDSGPILRTHDIALKFFEKEEKNEVHRQLLDTTIDTAFLTLKWYLIVSSIIYHVPIITALLVSLWKQEYILAINAHMPFTNPQTLFGYILNMVLQLMGSTMIFVIFMLKDVHLMIYPLQITTMVEIFGLKLDQLAQQLKECKKQKSSRPSNSRVQNEAERMMIEFECKKKLEIMELQFIVLIKEFEVYDHFITNILTYISATAFVNLSTNSVGIGLLLLEICLVSIPIGLALVSIILFQVLLCCAVGTLVSTQNKKLLDAVCGFAWYELSPKMRKVYLQFIHRCQNITEFELPIVGQVDMELFTSIVKSSYSYLNYLLNFT